MQIQQTVKSRRFSLYRPNALQELLFVGFAYFIYSQVRGLAGSRVVDAFSNGYRVVRLEQDLGIFKELTLQTWAVSNSFVMQVANFVYVWGLFPLLIPTAIFLMWRRPQVYVLVRNAFLLSGAIAAVCYLLVPTAPPRLMDLGFIDTLGSSLTPGYSSLPGVNHYAAVPSMHVGWSFLTAVALFRGFEGSRFRAAFLIWPAAMFSATVLTGNHYILDGALGIIVASAGLFVAIRIQRRAERKGLLVPLVTMPAGEMELVHAEVGVEP